MKRKGSTLLALVIAASLASCSSNSDEEIQRLQEENQKLREQLASQMAVTETTSQTTVSYTFVETEATTTESTTPVTTTTVPTESIGNWKYDYFVDKWDEKDLNNPYIRTLCENGKFTNSATLDGSLSVEVCISTTYAFLLLYTYPELSQFGYNDPVQSHSRDVNYEITILDESEAETNLQGVMYSQGYQLCLVESNYDSLVNLVNSNRKLKIICTKINDDSFFNDDTKYEYKFTLDCTGFDAAYKKLFEIKGVSQ